MRVASYKFRIGNLLPKSKGFDALRRSVREKGLWLAFFDANGEVFQ